MNTEFKVKKFEQFKQWRKPYTFKSNLSQDEEILYWGFQQQSLTGEPGYANIRAFIAGKG